MHDCGRVVRLALLLFFFIVNFTTQRQRQNGRAGMLCCSSFPTSMLSIFNETDKKIRTGRDNSNSGGGGGGRMHFDLLINVLINLYANLNPPPYLIAITFIHSFILHFPTNIPPNDPFEKKKPQVRF